MKLSRNKLIFNLLGGGLPLIPAVLLGYVAFGCNLAIGSALKLYPSGIAGWLSSGLFDLWILPVMFLAGGILSFLSRYGGMVTMGMVIYTFVFPERPTTIYGFPPNLPPIPTCGLRQLFVTGPLILSLYFFVTFWVPLAGGMISLLGRSWSLPWRLSKDVKTSSPLPG